MKPETVNTQVLFCGPPQVIINVPGVGFLKTLSSGVTHLKQSEDGKVLFIAPATACIVTNWDKPNHE